MAQMDLNCLLLFDSFICVGVSFNRMLSMRPKIALKIVLFANTSSTKSDFFPYYFPLNMHSISVITSHSKLLWRAVHICVLIHLPISIANCCFPPILKRTNEKRGKSFAAIVFGFYSSKLDFAVLFICCICASWDSSADPLNLHLISITKCELMQRR